MSKILITGAAGFIGFHVTQRLLNEGHTVVGVDNLNSYYDVNLKLARLKLLKNNFEFLKLDVSEQTSFLKLFDDNKFTKVIHLAAQPGIRYSLENPQAYIQSNIIGFFNVLEACRSNPVEHLIYASSSSVYGATNELPFKINDNSDQPLSLYAASKKSNELMAHSYSHSYAIPTTGLRFFTVYGPWGRPDMAVYSFTNSILRGETIKLHSNGEHYRSFTHVDDIVESILRILELPPTKHDNQSNSQAPWRVYNIGNQQVVNLKELIKLLEKYTNKQAVVELLPPQIGDMQNTHADVSDLLAAIDYAPQISIENGIRQFVEWFKKYIAHSKDEHA